LEVIRRPEDQIDKRQLALALIALARDINRGPDAALPPSSPTRKGTP